MKYTVLRFTSGVFSKYESNSMCGYRKNTLHASIGGHRMYVDTDKLEIGREKFKKALLKYYNNLITTIEQI